MCVDLNVAACLFKCGRVCMFNCDRMRLFQLMWPGLCKCGHGPIFGAEDTIYSNVYN